MVIVDDEQWIVQLIGKLIHWDELNMELIGQYHDGISAFEGIRQQNPDIVISDIRMPLLDGLGMIVRLKEEGIQSNFVLLSGYADFEYAQTALKYGVLDYLLKPVNEDQLNSILLEIKERCEQDQRKSREEEKLRTRVRKSQTLFEKEFFSELMAHSDADVAQLEQKYEIAMGGKRIRAFCLKLDYYDFEKAAGSKDMVVLHNVFEFLKERIKCWDGSAAIEDPKALRIIGLINFEEKDSGEVLHKLEDWFAEIKNYVYAFKDYEATISISEEKKKEAASLALQEAVRSMAERIVLGAGHLIRSGDVKRLGTRPAQKLFVGHKNAFVNAVQAFQVNLAYHEIDAAFGEIEEKKVPAENYFNLAREIQEACFTAYAMVGNKEEKLELEKKMQFCIRTSDLKALVKKQIKQYIASAQDEKSQLSHLPIRKAMDYVDGHYMDKLTLEEVAEKIGLNATYFSKLFKKESGKTFVNYLTEVRINQAKRLLSTTNDTMNSIAESVGYTDHRYFSQCFEKNVGMKPSLYRKLYAK